MNQKIQAPNPPKPGPNWTLHGFLDHPVWVSWLEVPKSLGSVGWSSGLESSQDTQTGWSWLIDVLSINRRLAGLTGWQVGEWQSLQAIGELPSSFLSFATSLVAIFTRMNS